MTSIHTTSFSDIRNHFLPKIATQYTGRSETISLKNLPHSIADAKANMEWSDRVIKDYSLWNRNIDPEIHEKVLQIATVYQHAEKSRGNKLSQYKTSITGIKVGVGFLAISGMGYISAPLAFSFLDVPTKVRPFIPATSFESCIAQFMGEILGAVISTAIIGGIVIMLCITIPAIIGIAIITFSTLFGSYQAWIHWDDHSKTTNQLKDLRFLEVINQCKNRCNDLP